jgi:hypothetical protein
MMKKNSLKPSVMFIIWFCAFKSVSLVNKNDCLADYNYYINRKYFIDVKISIIKKILLLIFTKFFSYLVKKGFV